MTLRILTQEIRYAHDVVSARQRARQLAARMGLDGIEQTRLATAVSEIARNAFRYAGGGTILFEVCGSDPQWLFVTVRDRGTGIADLELVLSGRYVSTTGMGVGIVGAQRLVDDFQLTSDGNGTVVRLGKKLPREMSKVDIGAIAAEIINREPEGPIDELQQQNGELMSALAELQNRQAEIERLNYELAETNRGVLALNVELEDKADSLRKASDSKSRFLSHISHELRTPLNSVRGLARILGSKLDGPLTPEQEKQVEFIRASADTLLELVNDLLDLAKIEAGRVEVQKTRFSVATLFSTLRGMFRPMATNPEVALEFDDVDELPSIVTDELKLSQVLRNFISNALKFTERGVVRVSAKMEGDTIRIAVCDTGIGIDRESLPLVFEEFVQIKNPLQKRQKGSGIGLPISMRLAKLLGGDVEVESVPGQGSTFTVTIPDVQAGYDSEQGQAAPRILVVDDAEVDRYTLRALLPTACDVVETSDSENAVKLAAEIQPTVIFLDLGMPVADGADVLRQLKSDPRTGKIRVIIYTSRLLTESERSQLLSLGAAAVIQKGFTDLESARLEIARKAGLTLAPEKVSS